MKQILLDNLGLFQAGECRTESGLAILPLFCKASAAQAYISLDAAIRDQAISIGEISQGGSVSNLRVINRGKIPVLLLDGEELCGAKQNRVLNASILVPAQSEIEIPVSCTERGRWHYVSPEFEVSGNVMAASIKTGKMESVSMALKASHSFRSDQGRVWEDIDRLHSAHKSHSRTSAMSDVYEQRKKHLDDICAAFPYLEGQCGIYAEIGGRFAGIDLLMRPDLWRDVHAKIVRSYAIDVVGRQLPEDQADPAKLEELFRVVLNSEVSSYKSKGLGDDVRVEHADLIGSALIWENELTHFAAYPRRGTPARNGYSSPRHRDLHI